MKPAERYLTIALDIVPSSDVIELLEDYGYTDEPSVDLLSKIFHNEEHGESFAQEFGELVKHYIDSPLANARLRQAVGLLNKGTGKEKQELTQEQKEQKVKNAQNWITYFADLGVKIFDKVINTEETDIPVSSGADSTPENKEDKTMTYVLYGGLGLITVVVIVLIFVMMLRRQ